jgi:hypothetical protein
MDVERQYDDFAGNNWCATRKGRVPVVECRVGKGSDDGDG